MDIKAIKDNLNRHVKLKNKGGDYILSGYILRRGKKDFIHQAELQDVGCGNSVIIAKLEDVEEMERINA